MIYLENEEPVVGRQCTAAWKEYCKNYAEGREKEIVASVSGRIRPS